MGFISAMAEKFKYEEDDTEDLELSPFKRGIRKTKKVIGIIVKVCYHLRKVILAAPVVYYALRLAAYNTTHLPDTVGLMLQSDGSFAFEMAKSLAVTGPLCITAGCIAMMFLARKALYPWAVSLFSLLLPILLLISNIYPI